MNAEFGSRTAIVTGGGSGIGAAVVRRLRRDGVVVAVLDRASTGSDGDLTIVCDVTDVRQVDDAVKRVAAEFGRLDHLVNAAGIGAQGTIETATDDEWRSVFEVNLLGAVRVSRAAMPFLRSSAIPSIVNVCSIAATTGLPERVVYGASKGALLALTLHMAADGVKDGIRVNAVNPGTADTPWVERLLASADDPDVERRALERRQPHGRLVTADEVADAIAYLLSPFAGSTSGTALAVDGGMAGLRLRPVDGAS